MCGGSKDSISSYAKSRSGVVVSLCRSVYESFRISSNRDENVVVTADFRANIVSSPWCANIVRVSGL